MGADLCGSRPQGNFFDLRRPQLTCAVKWGRGRPSLGDAGKHDGLTLRLTLLVLCFKDFFFFFNFLVVVGLHCCVWAFFSCSEPGLLFIVVRRLLLVAASLLLQSVGSGVRGPQ